MRFTKVLLVTLVTSQLSICLVSAQQSEITVEPQSPKQGQTMAVTITVADKTNPPLVSFDKLSLKALPISNDGTTYRALIGVPADLKPGNYKLKVDGSERVISVKAGKFAVQRLRLPPGKDNFISSPGEEETVNAAKKMVSPTQFWDGPFRPPSKARITSGFGLRRIVNGKLLHDYFHSGLDYAGGLGSPVKAAQGGKVVIAKTGWRLHGNTVAIDHGHGVISFYIHLSKVLVKQGQEVKAGQEIGKIGSTGRASGPHLHFSLYVNQNATSPFDWYAKTF